MPLGLISFRAEIDKNDLNHNNYSIYIDPKLSVNGYWVKDVSGTWINLASEAYGGKMVPEGDKLRLDFVIQDGGQFDTDGAINDSVSVLGTLGFMPQSFVEHNPKLPTVDHFWF